MLFLTDLIIRLIINLAHKINSAFAAISLKMGSNATTQC